MRLTTLGAALVMVGIGAGGASAQQTQEGQNMPYCLQGSTGQMNCGFASMESCNAAKTGQQDSCTANPRMTTGTGGGMGTGATGATPPPPGTGSMDRGSAPGTGTSTPAQR
jgi:hypothetical protein